MVLMLIYFICLDGFTAFAMTIFYGFNSSHPIQINKDGVGGQLTITICPSERSVAIT